MRGFPSSSESLHTLQIMRWHPAVPLMSGAPQLVGICVCIYKIRYCSRSLTKHVYNNNRNNKKSYCWKIQSHFRLVVSQFKRWRRRALRYCCFLPWGFCTSRNIFSGKKRSQYLLWLLLYKLSVEAVEQTLVLEALQPHLGFGHMENFTAGLQLHSDIQTRLTSKKQG